MVSNKSEASKQQFPIVGIACSFGGIDLLKKILTYTDQNANIAYVILHTLSTSHEKELIDNLAEESKLPIEKVTKTTVITPNKVYVITEKQSPAILGLNLDLKRDKDQSNLTKDNFFTSLADGYKNFAVGIILSDTTTAYSIGLEHIKENGGISFTASTEGSDDKQIFSNSDEGDTVDFVLKPEEIPEKIKSYFQHYPLNSLYNGKSQSIIEEELFRKVIAHIRIYSEIDFTHYKRPTLYRRIIRRMAICQVNSLEDYLKCLQSNNEETAVLVQELLIKVTSFYRDPGLFEDICEKLVAKISKQKNKDESIRIWSAGCATGEEVYTLAICLFKALEKKNKLNYFNIQIFGTDISGASIEKARKAVYSESALQNLSTEQKQKFFKPFNGGYQVSRILRENIVFAKHNMITDPPLAKMDLISCRNVLIYFDSFLQKKVLENFHFALNPEGVLLLGKSETAGTDSDLFLTLSKKNKTYSRKQGKGKYYRLPFKSGLNKSKEINTMVLDQQPEFNLDVNKQAQDVLLSSYAPTNALIDENFQVINTQGNISEFLKVQSGKPSHSILNMVPSSMAFEIRNGVHKLSEDGTDLGVYKKEIQIKNNDKTESINFEIVKLNKNTEPHYLIIFKKNSKKPSFLEKLVHSFKNVRSTDNSIKEKNDVLEKELALTRADMHKIGERQSQVNQDLQTTNEELLSNNEEMQSLNEELETSKEEVLSSNEELVIVNQELLEKQQQLENALTYSEGIITTLREPFLVLDKELCIISANASFRKHFMVMESQLKGKTIDTIQQGQWNNNELKKLLHDLIPKDTELVDFELKINLNGLGSRQLFLNAKEISYPGQDQKMILLAIEDATERINTLKKYKDTITKLNKANEHLENFARVASHDLQEPLRKIQIFASLLNQNDVEDKKAYLKKIEKSAHKMSVLIADLLTFSSISDKEELFDKTDLNATLSDITFDLEMTINNAGADVHIDELPVIEAIPVQMRQLFTNLISNGLKFSRNDVKPIIKVYSQNLSDRAIENHKLDPNKKYTQITVSDNGIGIDAKHQKQVFAIFKRLHSQSEYEGSGIGLALCKTIVKNHKGHIHIDSEVGNGTQFHVILPIDRN
ncbi:CheR family methyltransferase [Winogradskyella ursingii]|uniref:CheR family methyltransferase n=1 Tax=Winogradskyella ursingii TaxID=2686079 RepID=UPI0015C82F9D|nr:CheR family methyltransferase [Winogradskyella ursingii]